LHDDSGRWADEGLPTILNDKRAIAPSPAHLSRNSRPRATGSGQALLPTGDASPAASSVAHMNSPAGVALICARAADHGPRAAGSPGCRTDRATGQEATGMATQPGEDQFSGAQVRLARIAQHAA